MREPRVVCYKPPINLRLAYEALDTLVWCHGHELDSGDVFMFFNQSRDRCRIVWHDGTAFQSLEKDLQVVARKSDAEAQINRTVLVELLTGRLSGPRELLNTLRAAVLEAMSYTSAQQRARTARATLRSVFGTSGGYSRI